MHNYPKCSGLAPLWASSSWENLWLALILWTTANWTTASISQCHIQTSLGTRILTCNWSCGIAALRFPAGPFQKSLFVRNNSLVHPKGYLVPHFRIRQEASLTFSHKCFLLLDTSWVQEWKQLPWQRSGRWQSFQPDSRAAMANGTSVNIARALIKILIHSNIFLTIEFKTPLKFLQ